VGRANNVKAESCLVEVVLLVDTGDFDRSSIFDKVFDYVVFYFWRRDTEFYLDGACFHLQSDLLKYFTVDAFLAIFIENDFPNHLLGQ